jgi:hypothetical protein
MTKYAKGRNSKEPEYQSWRNMMKRCFDPDSQSYEDYGKRGIRVCVRWLNYENFYADMGPRPSPSHTLEREDNDGNYEPGNCRWATRKEQARNRRSSVLLTYQDKQQTVAAWAEELGIGYQTLLKRLKNRPVEEAFTIPVREGNYQNSGMRKKRR